ncbi:hypothetical protein AVEN_50416-1 [Araneus ventricosus]|uniref:Uncharacterized protein n=1 Tax=Araneus ventricosus TaxID=182803 RepID=A0A4Y2ETX9_ARAVE|nr:hypothetical protein AVEN_50416-1 [Araneus ventricosus]
MTRLIYILQEVLLKQKTITFSALSIIPLKASDRASPRATPARPAPIFPSHNNPFVPPAIYFGDERSLSHRLRVRSEVGHTSLCTCIRNHLPLCHFSLWCCSQMECNNFEILTNKKLESTWIQGSISDGLYLMSRAVTYG